MGTLVCKIEVDKQNGILVEIANEDQNITQTIHMDGTSITIKVEGEENTSTFVQTADSITINCKDFTLETSGTLTCKSQGATSHSSEDTFSVESTKDLSVSTQAKLTQSATKDMELTGSQKVIVKATAALEASGQTAKVSATAGAAEVSGVELKLTGQTKSELTGAMTKVGAQGKLDLESSGIANLKGNLTNVQGSLIKLG